MDYTPQRTEWLNGFLKMSSTYEHGGAAGPGPSRNRLEVLSVLLSPLELEDSELMVVFGTDYLQQVSELINHTEPSILNNYLVQKTTWSLNHCLESTQEKLLETLPGTKKSRKPRQQTRVSNMHATLGFPLGPLSATAAFNWQSKEMAKGMISEIWSTLRRPWGSRFGWMRRPIKQPRRKQTPSMIGLAPWTSSWSPRAG